MNSSTNEHLSPKHKSGLKANKSTHQFNPNTSCKWFLSYLFFILHFFFKKTTISPLFLTKITSSNLWGTLEQLVQQNFLTEINGEF